MPSGIKKLVINPPSNLVTLTPELKSSIRKQIEDAKNVKRTPEVPKIVPLTEDDLKNNGFILANKDDIIGSSDKTFIKETDNKNGRSVIIFDLLPHGNQGKPALHVYYGSTTLPVSIYFACFNAVTTVEELKDLIDTASQINPIKSENNRNFSTTTELLNHLKVLINTQQDN